MDKITISAEKRDRLATRRYFLRQAAVTATAISVPALVPSSVLSADSPSNRIHVAMIGCGNQSRVDLPSILRFDDVQVVAVCDVNRGSHGYARPEHFLGREPAQEKVNEHYAKKTVSGKYRGCDASADFREVLARDDVDAVMVVLPYYLHTMDKVQGAAHFEVSDKEAIEIVKSLQARLPGYLVPKLVREVAG